MAHLELGEGRDEEGVRDVAHAGENDALQLSVLGLQEPSNNWLTKEQNHEVEISATYVFMFSPHIFGAFSQSMCSKYLTVCLKIALFRAHVFDMSKFLGAQKL
jgi:hypothetical protein